MMGRYEPTRGAGSRRRGIFVLPLLWRAVPCCPGAPAQPAIRSRGAGFNRRAPPPLLVAVDPIFADLEERTFASSGRPATHRRPR